jgi:hypothetical protein
MFKGLLKKKAEFLYPDLPPKQRLLDILEKHVMPELQSLGFELLKTGPVLRKKEGNFEWRVEFLASSWNRGNEVCCYNPYFMVTNSDYKQFLKKHGYKNNSDGIVGSTSGCQHWDSRLFSENGGKAYFLEDFDFAKHDNNKLVKDLVANIKEVGIPYFKMMSNFDGIVNFYFKTDQRKDAPKMLDLCSVLNRPEQFDKILQWYDKDKIDVPAYLEEEIERRRKNRTAN